MHEDRAAAAFDPGPVVEAEHEHQIIEMVGALQPFRALPRRQLDEPIVVAIGGIFAPAIVCADRVNGGLGAWTHAPGGAVENLAGGETPKRAGAASFAPPRAS